MCMPHFTKFHSKQKANWTLQLMCPSMAIIGYTLYTPQYSKDIYNTVFSLEQQCNDNVSMAASGHITRVAAAEMCANR